MRYYYGNRYFESNGDKEREKAKTSTLFDENMSADHDDLVVEEDTIYEIDRECMKCQKKKGHSAR